MMVQLLSVYSFEASKYGVFHMLYSLLQEQDRESWVDDKVPTWAAHCKFVSRHPHLVWYAIKDDNQLIGSIYVTWDDKIGLIFLKAHDNKKNGQEALLEFMKRHPKAAYYANIRPEDQTAIEVFHNADSVCTNLAIRN
jgi:hypothetical protein